MHRLVMNPNTCGAATTDDGEDDGENTAAADKPKWVYDLGNADAEETQNQAMSLLRMLIMTCQGTIYILVYDPSCVSTLVIATLRTAL